MSESSRYRLKVNPEYGFFQIDPTPSREEITEFYTRDFYSSEYKKFNDSSLEVQIEDREFLEGRWDDMAHGISSSLGVPLSGLDLLDVGCGWAQALLYFREKGLNCYGFDPAVEAVEYAKQKNLEVRHAGLETMDVFEGMKFDVLMLNNVLEHLPDPVTTLYEIRTSILKPGGLLIVEVPNEFNDFQTAAQKLHDLPEWWVAPPGHLNYFSKDSLQALLEGLQYKTCIAESSFPLEMFLLFGDNYVSNPDLGRICHKKRVAFEANLRKLGKTEKLRDFYQALAHLNLGRQITLYATT